MKLKIAPRFSPSLSHFISMFSFARILNRQSPDNAFQTDADLARIAISENGMITYASPAFLTMAELSSKEMGQRHISSVFNFAEYEGPLQNLDPGLHAIALHGSNQACNFYFNWITTNKNELFLVGSLIENDSAPFQKASALDGFVKQFENEILQSPQNARERNKRRKSDFIPDLQPFFSLSGDMMVVINDSGEIIQNNEKFSEFFGKAEDRPEQDDFIDIFHDQDKPYIRNALQALYLDDGRQKQQTPAIDFEARIVTPKGSAKATEWRAQHIGPYLYCMGRDLSSVKSQQSALVRREKQLVQAESIGRMGHWNWTVGQDEIEWSEQIYNIFGVQPSIFVPSLESMRSMINRSDIGRVNQAFQRAVIEQNDYDMEFSIQRPDGETRFIRCEGRCSLDDEGDVIALYGIMQDMTERVIYEQQLKEAKDAAERAYAAKSQFLANMSHELRTPLNAIIGFSEMIERQMLGPIGTPKYLEYISGIHKSGEHLLDLISDILDMSKIEAGKYELDLEELKIARVIETCTHMMQGRALEAEVKIIVEKCTDIQDLTIVADRRAVMQILLNVLSNAVKFTNHGGKIEVECIKAQNGIIIGIRDNGIGIPANKLANITRPFEQASSNYARDHQGSGLGLAITKELTEMHGGALRIESEMGVGTCVSIYLPYDAYKAQMKDSVQ